MAKSRLGRANRIAAATFTGIALVYGVEASQLVRGTLATPGPGLFPLFIVTPALLVGSVGLLLAAHNEQGHVDWPNTAGWIRISIVIGAVTGYAAFAQTVGHALSATLLSLVILSVFGLYRLPIRILVAFAISVGFEILFSYILGANLPRGPFPAYW